jgi:beta-aspartyl-peptidase (threonine type)
VEPYSPLNFSAKNLMSNQRPLKKAKPGEDLPLKSPRLVHGKPNFGLVVHGGAGLIRRELKNEVEKRSEYLRKSVAAGYQILKKGGSAIDAIERAIMVMEDCAIFNAGSGSCLTIQGKIEPDAAIMNGDQSCGAVAHASVVKNPISLARSVMEKSDHVLIAGSHELEEFANAVGFPLFQLQPTISRKREWKRRLGELRSKGKINEWPRNSKLVSKSYIRSPGTVGAVALDSNGKLCAGVSTGGRFMKLPGRVGDSAIVGAGLYADYDVGAAVATGEGEEIIKVCLCKSACDFMKLGLDAQDASDAAINLISQKRGRGTAGIISIDRLGGLGVSRNTEMMPHSYRFSPMNKIETNGF